MLLEILPNSFLINLQDSGVSVIYKNLQLKFSRLKWIQHLEIWKMLFQKQPPRGVLKICSRITGEHPWRSVILTELQSSFMEITLRHWCSPVNLLQVAEHLFLRTPLDGCFCFSDNWKFIWLKEWNQVQVNKY